MNTNDKRIAALMRAKEDELARTKRALEIATNSMSMIEKACYCNRGKGFDYGEKHPKLGVCGDGRWLTPNELINVARMKIQKELGE